MDTMKRGPQNEFNFIQEKVVSRRKNKIRRFLISLGTTLFLAVIFGVVARVVFIKSETFLFGLFGIDETDRPQVSFPSNVPDGIEPGQLSPTPEPTITPAPTPTIAADDKEEDPNSTETTEPNDGTGEDSNSNVTVIEQMIEPTIENYLTMYSEVKQLATTCNYSLATVTAVESGVDWFNETYETRKSITGIVVFEDNVDVLVLTSLDKVKNADSIEVMFSGNISIPGVVWDYDSDYNLAVIAVDSSKIPEKQRGLIKKADFGESYDLTTGAPILALGNPNGYMGSMEIGMVTSKGSAVYVTDNKLDLFNTDITDTPESDGIIVNLKGEVVGIITRTFKEGLNANISTAIGITRLKPIIWSLINKTDRIYFGILGEDMPLSVLQDIKIENGIYVTEVIPDSPAFEAGLRQGDIITAKDEVKVNSMSGFSTLINAHAVEDTVTITVQRKSKNVLKEMEFKVTLKAKNK